MSDRHSQTGATRGKIGASVERSAWRRKTGDKSSEAPSIAGRYDEDYHTPDRAQRRVPLLWEEHYGGL